MATTTDLGVLYALYTEPFEAMGLDSFVTGPVAGWVYGEPRMTHDVDLVVHVRGHDVMKRDAAFPSESFDCPPADVIRIEMGRPRRGHFNLTHHGTGFKADVYLKSQTELHR